MKGKRLANKAAAADTAKKEQAERARASFERTVGEVLLFLGMHPLYEQMFLEEIGTQLLPSILLRQFRVLRDENGITMGYVSWARTDKKTRQSMLAGEELTEGSWQSGDDVVIVHAAGPTLGSGKKLLDKVKEEVFAGEEVRMLLTKADGTLEFSML